MCVNTADTIYTKYRELVLWSHYVDYIIGIQYVSIIDG